jgi:hypothetical protein
MNMAATVAVALTVLTLLAVLRFTRGPSGREPPRLKETIPFVSNTYQYLTDMGGFMDRAR